MPIRLPNLDNPACQLFIACGRLQSPDPRIKKSLKVKSRQEMTARVRMAGRTFVFLVDTQNHFHIDLTTLDFYDRGEAPKQTHTLKEIQEHLNVFVGTIVDVFAEGWFLVPVDELPSVMGAAIVPTEAGGVSIRTVGATLSVEGAPVSAVRWRLLQKASQARIELKTNRTFRPFTESYLQDLWQLIDSGFTEFFSRGTGK